MGFSRKCDKKNHALFSYFFRLRLKFSCMMELSRYPLDRQICDMQIASCKFQFKILIQGRNKVWKAGEIINMVVIICPPPARSNDPVIDDWFWYCGQNICAFPFHFQFSTLRFHNEGIFQMHRYLEQILSFPKQLKTTESFSGLWIFSKKVKTQVGYIIFHSLA